jgi:nicotinate-nucleotide adenylyltransferase
MIGIFGGTFDPVHYGHLRSAIEVKEIFGLNEVRLIPSAQPPHRTAPHAPATMRADMLMLATENYPGLIVDTRELDRQGASFMIDTLVSLRHDNPHCSLLLIIGSDAFNQLTSWRQWQHLFDFAHIVVLTRPGSTLQQLNDFFAVKLTINKQDLSDQLAGKLYFQPVTQLDISASKIREIIAYDRNPTFLLPDSVVAYIKHNQLYQSQTLT